MFLLSGPQREGAEQGTGEERGRGRERDRRDGLGFFSLSWLAREIRWAEHFGHHAPTLSPALTEEAHSLNCWLPLPCHPQEGKTEEEVGRKEEEKAKRWVGGWGGGAC